MPACSDAIRFLAGTFASLVLGAVAVLASFWFQIGHDTVDSAGRCRAVEGKIDLAAQLQSPKIVFVGGSSVHWGIKAQTVAASLGRDGMNFGTFAALGPDVILWEARQTLRPGDTAVLALEYSMYAERNLTSDAISFALGCGGDYLHSLSPLEWAQMAFASDLARPLHVLLRRWEDLSSPEGGQDAAERSPYGDPVAASFKGEASAALKERLQLYQPLSIRVEPDGRLAHAVAEFARWAARNDVAVVATWPNTIWFDTYRDDPAFDRIRALYANLDIPMLGEPQTAMYAADLFYDTQYHLSKTGIDRRTRDLLPVLKAGLNLAPAPQREASGGHGPLIRPVQMTGAPSGVAR